MSRGKKKSKFEKLQEQAANFYFNKWQGNERICPALGEKVYVTRLGWNHLLNPPKHRGKSDKVERLRIIPLAKKLLETTTTIQEKRRRGQFYFYGIEATMDGTRLRVVVSSKGPKGKKYFYSVIFLNT